jgi:hypothetical protein
MGRDGDQHGGRAKPTARGLDLERARAPADPLDPGRELDRDRAAEVREQRAIARLHPPGAAGQRGARRIDGRHARGLDPVHRREPGLEQRAEARMRRLHLGRGDVAAGGGRGRDRALRALLIGVELGPERGVEAPRAPQAALRPLPLVGEARRLGVAPEQVALRLVQPVGAALPRDAEARGVGPGAPADAILGLEHEGVEAELARPPRGGESGGAGADDHEIEVGMLQGRGLRRRGRPAPPALLRRG